MKLKKCKICNKEFKPRTTTQKCCSWPCALDYADQQDKRKQKSVARKAKKEFYNKDRKHQLKLAQTAFNSYVRQRDQGNGCISCGKPDRGSDKQFHAGHMLSRGAHPELRFNELNCWLQCQTCNLHLSGNLEHYLPNLIKKIGQKKVDWLYNNNSTYKLTLDDIIDIKNYYKEQLKILQSNGFDKWAEGL